jgi:hypothetical protein
MKKLAVLTILTIFCAAMAVNAQTQFGTITGQIKDPSDAVVSNATVKLTNVATGVVQTSTSNDAGIYILPNVPAGDYELSIEVSGFHKYVRKLKVEVASRVTADAKLTLGSTSEVVVVEANAATVNLATGDMSTMMSNKDIQIMPLLNRNPYQLIQYAPATADTGAATGDTEGVGISVGGARTRSVNFMLDGGEHNDTFGAGSGQSVPQDAIEEFRLQTNNMTAEFGRNAVVANVITKSGGNAYHGSVYEFHRDSGLSATNYDDVANGTPKPVFVRNQFGGSIGGPIIKEKTFFFGSFEGIIVRSSASRRFYVPTQNFLNAAAPNARAFIRGFGEVPVGDSNQVITAQQIIEDTEGNGPGSYTDYPLIDYNTGQPLPANTALFSRYTVKAPVDAGGGDQQDTYLLTIRVDHSFSPNTRLFGRFAYQKSDYPVGSNSISPFSQFNTGWNKRFQNYAVTLTHNFSPRMFSESRVVYNRINENQPLGEAPGTTPCWSYDLLTSTPTGDSIVFPGYLPDTCFGFAIPFGGPQNIYQFYEGMTLSRGKHTLKWGGQYVHIRDNRTFGAFQTGYYDTFTMQGMLDGLVDFMYVGIDPKGKFPGEYYSPDTDGSFSPPSFTRHYRYNEFAAFFEDSLKLTNRLNLTLGLRWEYFGVLHSPAKERYLDANLYLNAVGSPDPNKSIFEQVRDARFSRTNNFYNQDFTNLAPRIGFAYDLFGNGRTVIRGGYGLFYDRNFGNALFNTIQNFPNYAVISQVPQGSFGGTYVPIELNQFDSLNALMEGGSLRLTGSARMLDREMKTAYSSQWNLTAEHDILGSGVIGSISYLGANGYHLYSLNNLNQLGSCLLAPTANAVCNPAGSSSSRLNQTGLTGMNRRGNEGLSRYNAMAVEIRAPKIWSTGLGIKANYTWAHSIDNASSFFGDSTFESTFGFGFRDPYNPSLDRANSTNDIRHRINISGQWTVPFTSATSSKWINDQLIKGWTLAGIFSAQTGAAFTVYDGSASSQCNNSGTNFCHPLMIGNVPERTEISVNDSNSPNTFTLYDNLGQILQTQETYCEDDLACTARLSNLQGSALSPRNMFRTPGLWNMHFAIVKEFPLPKEGIKLRFNMDFLNVFNHPNLYAYPGSNVFSGGTSGPGSRVTGRRGIDAGDGKDQRNIQLALHLMW